MIQANQTCIESFQKSLADHFQMMKQNVEEGDQKQEQKQLEIDGLKSDIQSLQDGLQSKGNLHD